MTSAPLRIATINVQDGGIHHPGGLDHVINELFATVPAAPSLIVVNEARGWDADGTKLGWRAAAVLRERFGPRYQIRVGHMERAPVPPAVLWDPDQLGLTRFDTPHTTPEGGDVWNRAIFDTAWWTDPLTVMPIHWNPWDRDKRMSAARDLSGLLGPQKRTIVVGDFNCSPSGDPALWPFTDFEEAPEHLRHHKGWQPHGEDGPWEAHTAPLDHLIGRWNPATGTRVGGIRWSTALEVAWEKLGRPAIPFPATVNDGIDPGGGMVIDHALLSQELAEAVIAEETEIHLPQGPPVSDHRMFTTAVDTGADAS